MLRALLIVVAALALALPARAQVSYPGNPLQISATHPAGLPAGIITGSCGTVDAVAFFSATATLACDSTFTFTPSIHQLNLTGFIATSYGEVDANDNGAIGYGARNSGSGVASRAYYFASGNTANAFGSFEAHSHTWTTSGLSKADQILFNFGDGLVNGVAFVLQSSGGAFDFSTTSDLPSSVNNVRLHLDAKGATFPSHIIGSGAAAPTFDASSTCTTFSVPAGSDTSFSFAASCLTTQTVVINFAVAYSATPVCTVTASSANSAPAAIFALPSTSALTMTATVTMASTGSWQAVCIGRT